MFGEPRWLVLVLDFTDEFLPFGAGVGGQLATLPDGDGEKYHLLYAVFRYQLWSNQELTVANVHSVLVTPWFLRGKVKF